MKCNKRTPYDPKYVRLAEQDDGKLPRKANMLAASDGVPDARKKPLDPKCHRHVQPDIRETDDKIDDVLVATFKPGPLGIKCKDWFLGHIIGVDEKGAAHAQGVTAGMQFKTINDLYYTEPLLNEVLSGKKDFTVTFWKEPRSSLPPLPPPAEL